MRAWLLAVLLAIIAAACGGSTATTTSTTVPPATTTTTLPSPTTTTTTAPPPTVPPASTDVVVAIDVFEGFTFNPLRSEAGLPPALAEAFLAGALRQGDNGELLPFVATEIPTVDNGRVVINSDNTMDVTYTIHPEARWSDGVPITGDDFVFTFKLISGDSSLLSFDRDAYDRTISVSTNGNTVTATLQQPTILYLDLFEILVPRHAVAGTDFLSDWDLQPWPSGGPFVLAERDERLTAGARLTFVANEHYWITDGAGKPLPRLDEVVFELQGDPELTKDGFANGSISVWEVPSWQPLLDFAAMHGTVDVIESPIWEHFTFNFGTNNTNAESLNANVNFRRAVARGIDREALIADSPWGARQVLNSPFELYGVGQGSWDRYPYDQENARKLLFIACTEVGRDCEADPPPLVLSSTSNSDERPRIGKLVVEQLREIGIDASFDPQDSTLFFGDTIDAGTFDLGQWAWVRHSGLTGAVQTARLFDPENPPLSRFAGGNFSRYGTPAVTGAENPLLNQPASIVQDEHTANLAELIAQLGTTVDTDDFADLVAQIEEILADQVVFIPLVARGQAVAYRDVAGIDPVTALPPTWNIEEWTRP